MRLIWIPGVQYEGESAAAMARRETALREMDRALDAEEAAAAADRARPLPHLEQWARDRGLWDGTRRLNT